MNEQLKDTPEQQIRQKLIDDILKNPGRYWRLAHEADGAEIAQVFKTHPDAELLLLVDDRVVLRKELLAPPPAASIPSCTNNPS